MTDWRATTIRVGAVLLAAATVWTSGMPANAAPPGITDYYKYYVVNGTEHAIVLAGYLTGDPYPESVTPAERIEPGQKFEIVLRQFPHSYSVRINFDTFDKAGKRIPGGLVELKLHLDDVGGHFVTRSVACWPGPDRACVPRGWSQDYVDTVSFVG